MKPSEVENLRLEILSIRSRCDSVLALLPSPAPANETHAEPERIYMTTSEFAKYRQQSTKTISRYCAAGMPHSGDGHSRRIKVKDAVSWIDNGGPQNAAKLAGMAAR